MNHFIVLHSKKSDTTIIVTAIEIIFPVM